MSNMVTTPRNDGNGPSTPGEDSSPDPLQDLPAVMQPTTTISSRNSKAITKSTPKIKLFTKSTVRERSPVQPTRTSKRIKLNVKSVSTPQHSPPLQQSPAPSSSPARASTTPVAIQPFIPPTKIFTIPTNASSWAIYSHPHKDYPAPPRAPSTAGSQSHQITPLKRFFTSTGEYPAPPGGLTPKYFSSPSISQSLPSSPLDPMKIPTATVRQPTPSPPFQLINTSSEVQASLAELHTLLKNYLDKMPSLIEQGSKFDGEWLDIRRNAIGILLDVERGGNLQAELRGQ